MDQESFRKLLQTPRPGGTPTSAAITSRSLLTATKSKTKKADPAQPAFKPRNVKKTPAAGDYRDRAAERRLGIAHDYAQIEALAEDFERKNAEIEDRKAVEEQRKYLGGDSDHSVLVKGLDFALLEQNRARVAASTEDDDTLEQAFLEASSSSATSVPKKRTREDIVRELKNKRQKGDAEEGREGSVEGTQTKTVDASLDEAKKAGKFKPIGFKPIGSAAAENGEKAKKKKSKVAKEEKGGVKKKKRKIEAGGMDGKGTEKEQDAMPLPAAPQQNTSSKGPSAPEPEPIDEDFDIFAGAGDYEGEDLGDDEDAEGEVEARGMEDGEASPSSAAPPVGGWVAIDEPDSRPARSVSKSRSPPPQASEAESRRDRERQREEEEREDGEEAPMRLVPLASSSIPSIRDILAMDEAAEKEQKRKARKEKKKAGLSTEAKVDRDYQRLKSYTEKKKGGKT